LFARVSTISAPWRFEQVGHRGCTAFGSLIRIINAIFDAQLFDVSTGKRVWRASIAYGAGSVAPRLVNGIDMLVNGIADALAKDGLVVTAPGTDAAAAPKAERATLDQ
jgi:hypothetical protein